MAEKEIQILDDQPISDAKFFNFDAYSEALARIITREKTNTPLVVGIFGKWGSGKTSLMKTLEQKIRNAAGGYPAQTIWFSAWKYDKEDAIWRALLMRVLEELKTRKKEEERTKEEIELDNKLDDLQTSLYQEVHREELGSLTIDWGKAAKGTLKLGLSMLPAIGGNLAKLFDIGAKEKGDIVTIFESIQREKKTLNVKKVQFLEEFQYRFEEIIDEHYVKKNKRAVIFIDDLDRCVPEKAIEVLEAIKLFLDVKGCIFILGIDRSVIAQGVDIKYKDFAVGEKKVPITGDDYLEKIIQLSFMLPPIASTELEKFIKDLKGPEEEFYTPYLEMIITGIGNNPRKIKRFINIIEFQRNLADVIFPEVQSELKKSFNALLIEWQIINSSTDYSKLREAVLEEPELLLKIHEYVSKPSEKPPEELNPFLDSKLQNLDSKLQKLITAFPYKEIPNLKVIEQVIHLSHVAGATEMPEEVPEDKPMTRKQVEDAIRKGESLEGKDLSRIDLKGLPLKKKNLNGVNLVGANLSETDLSEAKLIGADLSHADLSGATLLKTDLSKARLTYTNLSRANLSEAILNNTTLSVTNFNNAILYKADLTEAYLNGSDFSYTKLSGAKLPGDLTGNDFTGADFSKTDLSKVDLKGTKLSWANLSELDLTNVPLSGADLSNAKLINTKLPKDLAGTILSGADLSRAKLSGSTLTGDLSGIILTDAELTDVKFTKVTGFYRAKTKGVKIVKSDLSKLYLSSTDFSKADLTETILNDVNLSKAKLMETKLFNAKLQRAVLSNADLSNAKLHGADFFMADLSGAVLTDANLSGTDLLWAKLIETKTTGVEVDENTKAVDVILVRDEDSQDKAKIKDALDNIDKALREVILRNNETYRNIYYSSERTSD